MDSACLLLRSPTPIFPTHHQDPIGDDFRNRLLTVKEEGFTGHHPLTMTVEKICSKQAQKPGKQGRVVDREICHPTYK